MSLPQGERVEFPEVEGAGAGAFVESFLRTHPHFLAERPGLYAALAPPARMHGDGLTDHMAAMLRVEREKSNGLVAAGRATAGFVARVQDAVVALLRAPDPAECVADEMPGLLGVDAAQLCAEFEQPRTQWLPDGTVARLLDGRQVVFREEPCDAPMLHGAAAGLARHDAIVQVPGNGAPMLLALLTRDRHVLDPAQGSGPLAFLGRAVAAALGR